MTHEWWLTQAVRGRLAALRAAREASEASATEAAGGHEPRYALGTNTHIPVGEVGGNFHLPTLIFLLPGG